MESVATRLADMDAMDVDIQVISVSEPVYYWAAPLVFFAQMINDEMAEDIAKLSDRVDWAWDNSLAKYRDGNYCQLRCVSELGLKGWKLTKHCGTVKSVCAPDVLGQENVGASLTSSNTTATMVLPDNQGSALKSIIS